MSERIIEPPTYYRVFAALIGLTLLTLAVSFLHLPTWKPADGGVTISWHLVVGLSIATVKALLVILIFMHLMYSHRVTWLVAAAGLYWLGILMFLTMADYMTRVWLVY
jgi:cytochrome c oxidase subunit 4